MQQQDNNSTTDLSSLSSAFEHNNDVSDEFMKIDGGGIRGFFERLPLWLKLLAITLLATLIMLTFAVWLSGVEVSIAITLAKNRRLTKWFLVAAHLVNALQRERDTAVLFIIKPTDTSLENLLKSTVDTDADWAEFTTSERYDSSSSLVQQNALLQQMRNGVRTQRADGYFIYQCYTSLITSILDIIMNKSKEELNQNVISTEHIFLRLQNLKAQLRSFGTLAFTNKNSSLDPLLYNEFKELLITRDELQKIWMVLASQDQISLFNRTVMLTPEYSTAMAMERIALAGNPSSFSMSIDSDSWRGNTSVVHNACGVVLSTMLTEADNLSFEQLLLQTCIHFTVILILVIVFIVLYAVISYCFSRTIIGPWVRMNKLQESVTYKFVPRGLLRMIGCNNIMQVQIGKHSTKQVVLMKIVIRDYWHQVESLSVDNRILYTNRFFDSVNPLLVSYGGYIDTMKPDELQVCFKTPGSAVTCANKIHLLMKTLNMSDFAPLYLTIAIHAASYADLAIVGDHDRIQGVVISKLQLEAQQIMSIAKRFQCKTAVSSNVIEMLKEKIDGVQLIAMIDGKTNFVIYEVSSKLNKSEREQFSMAVRDLFVDHNIVDALAYFKTNDSEAAKFYTKVCEQVLEQCKAQITNLTVKNILNEPVLEEIVSQTCQKEQSTENLEVYISIKLFKEAWATHNREAQSGHVNSIKIRMDQVNITETLKQSLLKQATEEETWDENMFYALECEIITLLTDTIKRLKISDNFRRAYIKCKGMKSDLLLERFGDY